MSTGPATPPAGSPARTSQGPRVRLRVAPIEGKHQEVTWDLKTRDQRPSSHVRLGLAMGGLESRLSAS